VADLGTGTGTLCRAVAQEREPVAVVGVDFSKAAMSAAEQRDAALGIQYEQADLQESLAGLEQGTWDVVTLCEVIEHVSAPVAVVRNAVALLRRGGTLIVSCPHDDSIPSHEHVSRWGHDELYHLLAPISKTISFFPLPATESSRLLCSARLLPRPDLDLLVDTSETPDGVLVETRERLRRLNRDRQRKKDRIRLLENRVAARDERIAALKEKLDRLEAGREGGSRDSDP
jgi:SAM-dependent methyltransferase